jgi:transposase
MKYTIDERLDIGRRIYDSELSCNDAAEQYDINYTTARDYMRLYRDTYHLPPKKHYVRSGSGIHKTVSNEAVPNYEEYKSMSKEELIHELVMARINEARLKKGYEVKGDGSVILYGQENTK